MIVTSNNLKKINLPPYFIFVEKYVGNIARFLESRKPAKFFVLFYLEISNAYYIII